MAELSSFVASLEHYRDHGIEPGSCLYAILANDLMEAMGRADRTTRYIVFDICAWIYNNLPSVAHGSYEQVDGWINHKGFSGLDLDSAILSAARAREKSQ